MFMYVHMCAGVWACMQRPEDNIGYPSLGASHFRLFFFSHPWLALNPRIHLSLPPFPALKPQGLASTPGSSGWPGNSGPHTRIEALCQLNDAPSPCLHCFFTPGNTVVLLTPSWP